MIFQISLNTNEQESKVQKEKQQRCVCSREKKRQIGTFRFFFVMTLRSGVRGTFCPPAWPSSERHAREVTEYLSFTALWGSRINKWSAERCSKYYSMKMKKKKVYLEGCVFVLSLSEERNGKRKKETKESYERDNFWESFEQHFSSFQRIENSVTTIESAIVRTLALASVSFFKRSGSLSIVRNWFAKKTSMSQARHLRIPVNHVPRDEFFLASLPNKRERLRREYRVKRTWNSQAFSLEVVTVEKGPRIPSDFQANINKILHAVFNWLGTRQRDYILKIMLEIHRMSRWQDCQQNTPWNFFSPGRRSRDIKWIVPTNRVGGEEQRGVGGTSCVKYSIWQRGCVAGRKIDEDFSLQNSSIKLSPTIPTGFFKIQQFMDSSTWTTKKYNKIRIFNEIVSIYFSPI